VLFTLIALCKKENSKMKIVMPLFQFSLKELDSFYFGSAGLSIKPFDHTNIQEIVLFPEQNLRHMRTEVGWSLIYESEKDEIVT